MSSHPKERKVWKKWHEIVHRSALSGEFPSALLWLRARIPHRLSLLGLPLSERSLILWVMSSSSLFSSLSRGVRCRWSTWRFSPFALLLATPLLLKNGWKSRSWESTVNFWDKRWDGTDQGCMMKLSSNDKDGTRVSWKVPPKFCEIWAFLCRASPNHIRWELLVVCLHFFPGARQRSKFMEILCFHKWLWRAAAVASVRWSHDGWKFSLGC